jgi:transitional endoplasmic reticulum ATPase
MDVERTRELNLVGNERLNQNDFDGAAAAYREALAIDPEGVAYPRERGIVYANLGYALFLSGRYADARDAYQEALRLEPRRPNYHNELGDTLFQLERWDAAAAEYQRAINLDVFVRTYPQTPGLMHFNLANALVKLGECEDAHRQCAEAVKREPYNEEYRRTLERVAAELLARKAAEGKREAGAAETPAAVDDIPAVTFADVGGCEAAKETLRQAARIALDGARAARYRVAMNGILLYGPPGSGKTFLAEATAGEFKLPFFRVSVSDVTSKWVGEGVEKLNQAFEAALRRTPCMLFFDDLDSFVGKMQTDSTMDNRRLADAFIQRLDACRAHPGVVVVAATSHVDALDEAAVRPGRFDWRVCLHAPDTAERYAMLTRLFAGRPTEDLDLGFWAERTKGFSAADLSRLANASALLALNADAPISDAHAAETVKQFEATERMVETSRTWDDIVLDPTTREAFALIQRLLEDPDAGRAFGLAAPRGAVLYGPPGTGKTTLARVLAREAQCSFYTLTPSDIYSKWAGESERRVTEIFNRARANRPSIVFLDEADALFGRRSSGSAEAAPHANHVVNQFLAEMDGIRPNDRVFVLAATNRVDLIDPALLRAGRLSEKVAFPPPDAAARGQLFRLFVRDMKAEATIDWDDLALRAEGASGADIEEICRRAARMAFLRCLSEPLAPQRVTAEDFDRAVANWSGEGACVRAAAPEISE